MDANRFRGAFNSVKPELTTTCFSDHHFIVIILHLSTIFLKQLIKQGKINRIDLVKYGRSGMSHYEEFTKKYR